MAYLNEDSVWTGGITQIETTTALLGGPGGPLNVPHQELNNRIQYLKDKLKDANDAIESLQGSLTAAENKITTLEQGVAGQSAFVFDSEGNLMPAAGTSPEPDADSDVEAATDEEIDAITSY